MAVFYYCIGAYFWHGNIERGEPNRHGKLVAIF